jgi:hypothetical protein
MTTVDQQAAPSDTDLARLLDKIVTWHARRVLKSCKSTAAKISVRPARRIIHPDPGRPGGA